MKAKCAHRKGKFSIAHGRESDVKQNGSTALYKDMTGRLALASKCNRIISFFVKEGTSKEHAVTSELTLYYRNVKHSLTLKG
jgi:hypothetical protein